MHIRRAVPNVSPRAGFSLIGMLAALGMVAVAVSATLYWATPWFREGTQVETYMTDPVKVGLFVYDVTERGEVQSSSNVEVRCEVESRGAGTGGGTPILEIVPEGTIVKPGDFLVKLDDSSLRSEMTAQQIVVNTAEATLIQSKSAVKTAEIAKKEYDEGIFKQEEALLQSEVFLAEVNTRRAQAYLEYSRTLMAKGYYTKPQLEADEFAVEQNKSTLRVGETKLTVLREFTRAKMLEQLQATIDTAVAKLRSDEESFKLEQDKLQLIKDQVAKCVMTATAAGQVVYANSNDRRGEDIIIEPGTMLREGQAIIRLPDPKQMEVESQINESRIDYVVQGQPVRIRLEALPGTDLKGLVKRVNDYPTPTSSWLASASQDYAAFVDIQDPPPALRPGMTAEISIRVAQIPDAIQVPVHTVFERGGRNFCLVPGADNQLQPREVEIGTSNEKFVVIRSGLASGDRVVSNPRNYLNRVDLPASSTPDPKEMMANVPTKADRRSPAAGGETKATQVADAGGATKAGEGAAAGGGRAEGAGRGEAKGGGRGGEGGGRGPSQFAAMMTQMDTNRDGKIESSEMSSLPEQFRSRLMGADTNSDGAIDAQEQEAIKRMISAAAAGGPPRETGDGGAP